MTKYLVVLATLALAGCSAGPIKDRMSEADKATLIECQATTQLKEMWDKCLVSGVWQNGGIEHWDNSVAAMEPDMRLLAALMRSDTTAAKTAIANGANVNSVYSNATLYGPTANDPERVRSALSVAVGNFDIETVEMLLQEGADPSSNPFTGQIGSTKTFKKADGTWITVTGLQMAEMGLKYGLVATPEELFRLERWAKRHKPGDVMDIWPFYERYRATATPDVFENVAGLWEEHYAKVRADKQERIAKQAETAAWKAEHKANMQRINQAANERIRVIGTRICKEVPTRRGTLIYIGFVEGLAPEKIQIRVSNAIFKNAPSMSPGGFREHIIWDHPDPWSICE